MLQRETVQKEISSDDSCLNTLIELDRRDLVGCIRQLNAEVTEMLLSASDVPQQLVQDGAPVEISPRRFLKAMAPFICMN